MIPDAAWLTTLLAALADPRSEPRLYQPTPDGPMLLAGAPGPLPAAVLERLADPRLPAPDAPTRTVGGWKLQTIAGPAGTPLLLVHRPLPPTPADDAAAFSFTVSHDLRAPLRIVDGFARILKEDYGRQLDRIGNDHVDRIIGAAARMNAMIDAMLDLARLSASTLDRTRVDLTAMAHEIADELQRQDPQRQVTWDIAPGLKVQGDPTLLRQVLDNLLSNAWKFTGRTADARIAFTACAHDGERCTYEVRDNGAGFDPRSATRLFGLFNRLHSASDFPGTGIGLASVRRIVRRHGGDIVAEGRPGEGARFRFTLPEAGAGADA